MGQGRVPCCSSGSKRNREVHQALGNPDGVSCFLRPLDDGGAQLASLLACSSGGIFRLGPDKVYTVGRRGESEFDVGFFGGGHRCISRRHCQLFLDSSWRKLFLVDGFFRPSLSGLVETRRRFRSRINGTEKRPASGVVPSLNGTFVNGRKLRNKAVIELSVGDEISIGCMKWVHHGCKTRYGFVVERINFEGVTAGSDLDNMIDVETNRKYRNLVQMQQGCTNITNRAVFLLNLCRTILESREPVNFIREIIEPSDWIKPDCCNAFAVSRGLVAKDTGAIVSVSNSKETQSCNLLCDRSVSKESFEDTTQKSHNFSLPSDGKLLFLNRLEFMEPALLQHDNVVSLPDLFYPIGSLKQVFVATFTSDIKWFLTSCCLPNHLPVTIACHSAEKCWSAGADKRTFRPFSDYPNLLLIFPPFPDAIAFGKDCKKRGVGCHHPKLFLLQREDTIRVIITSANLVSRQWNNITNTVWWQDFPRRSTADYSAFFIRTSSEAEDSISDFAAQLAGFMSFLVIDIPEQAYWIMELAKYDFSSAAVYLIASVPGIHMPCTSYFAETKHWLAANKSAYSRCVERKLLGSVLASVVGISHRFKSALSLDNAQLRTVVTLLGNCHQDAYGMTEVLLKRSTSIPADSNAVSIFVLDPDELQDRDCVQLGFLPREIAKWVSPLVDAGFLSFSACIFPKEVIASVLGGSSAKVQLILYMSQGPNFSELPSLIRPEHFSPLCSLFSCMQRFLGLWRLQEVLDQYRWPESLETEFIYGSSSIGTSVSPQFLAAFAAAGGKRFSDLLDSEESDPEWGRWNVNHEMKAASIKILFPTIDRVKNGAYGVQSCRFMLSLSERTWQRLRHSKVFHDAIPHPEDRVGYPMHVKVARRRFQSEDSSFGWVYCGSHNFSPAAWGHLVQCSSGVDKGQPVLDSSSSRRLHICNYELGILFVVPPPDNRMDTKVFKSDLDAMILPYVVPAPRYQPSDHPATTQVMREIIALEKESYLAQGAAEEIMDEEVHDEEDIIEVTDFAATEKEEEKIYAEMLWS